VLLGVDDSGVLRVADGAVTRVVAIRGALRAMEVEPGGALWVSALASIHRVTPPQRGQVVTSISNT